MTTATVQIPGYVVGTWDVDPVHSSVGFVVRHLGISKVHGRFNDFEAEIVTRPDPLESSVSAKVGLASVDTGNTGRDDHLRSADFFGVEENPYLTYQSSGIAQDGDGFVLDGELTLKGVTRRVPLRLEVLGFGPDPFLPDPGKGARAGFSATTEIDRRDFGVTFNSPLPGGGVALGNKVQIHLEIQAALRAGRVV
ncbi:YceI family protein [Planobispora siamensis]|uniref:Lipid/polyisoprenoid-binding YceI-like domain-containing protein n=1 Tax=Planobispora siamensis TaxID=936338 RepID=A0A8J3SMJ8_9ACTN|nr:YceI family protein [Planobispora siamensis]GIH97208.1 hypothetical protein Psi01_78380 [Planobispora siamensis]